jgi:hypothetical protein
MRPDRFEIRERKRTHNLKDASVCKQQKLFRVACNSRDATGIKSSIAGATEFLESQIARHRPGDVRLRDLRNKQSILRAICHFVGPHCTFIREDGLQVAHRDESCRRDRQRAPDGIRKVNDEPIVFQVLEIVI